MLFLDNITIGYRNKTVACGLTAHLPSGTMTCLIGRNGTGKSTLLRTIASFQPPMNGTIAVTLSGRQADITSLTPGQKARLVGVVLTERTFVDNMSVREMVAMGRSPYTGFWGRLSHEDYVVVDEALRMTGMEGFAMQEVNTLSDGERQKVMIAKALAQQTPLIVLDEPTAFLDYPSKIAVMAMLRRLCREQGKTVVLSTHDLDAALRLADRIWLMEWDGLTEGTAESLKDKINDFMGL